MQPDDQRDGAPSEAVEDGAVGRHRAGGAAISLQRNGMRSARKITNSYLGRSARLLPVVGFTSVLTALAQALVLVVLAATAVALVRDGHRVSFSAGPLHETMPIWAATSGAAAASLLIIVLQVWSGRITARLAKVAEGECRRRIVAAYLGAPWELVAQRERGELQQLLTNNVFRVSRAVVYRSVWIFGVANLLILLTVGLLVSPLVSGLMIGVGVLLSLPLRPIKKRTERAASQHNTAERQFATFIAAMVEQARETRVFNVGAMLGKRSLDLSDEASERQRRMQFLMWTTPAIYFGAALLALTLGVALLASVGSSHLADVGTIVVLFMRSLVYGQTAIASTQYIVEATPYLVELNENLDVYNASHRPDGTREAHPIERLELDDVQYTYPGAPAPALRGVTITISRGEAIGIVGATGGGKSTLAEVLLRLRETSAGTYTVNGIPANDLSRGLWGRQVAYVPQQSLIFDGTIRDNIRYFRPWLTDADIEAAAREAQIDAEIRAMESGYETVVAGLSVGLSGGQRQRICIARALAGRPELLVMDEPTSGLDIHSERLFIETIGRLRGHTTLVVIAHRLDTIAMCDRIVNIKSGRIEAIGRPQEMLGRDGLYSGVGTADDNGVAELGEPVASEL